MKRDETMVNAYVPGQGNLSVQDQALVARRQRLLGPAYRLFYETPVHLVRGAGVWLYDAEGKAYRSIIYAREFNCRKEQSRILSWQRKSESMGNGAVVSEHSQVSEWTDVKTPNAKRLMMAACEQR